MYDYATQHLFCAYKFSGKERDSALMRKKFARNTASGAPIGQLVPESESMLYTQ